MLANSLSFARIKNNQQEFLFGLSFKKARIFFNVYFVKKWKNVVELIPISETPTPSFTYTCHSTLCSHKQILFFNCTNLLKAFRGRKLFIWSWIARFGTGKYRRMGKKKCAGLVQNPKLQLTKLRIIELANPFRIKSFRSRIIGKPDTKRCWKFYNANNNDSHVQIGRLNRFTSGSRSKNQNLNKKMSISVWDFFTEARELFFCNKLDSCLLRNQITPKKNWKFSFFFIQNRCKTDFDSKLHKSIHTNKKFNFEIERSWATTTYCPTTIFNLMIIPFTIEKTATNRVPYRHRVATFGSSSKP